MLINNILLDLKYSDTPIINVGLRHNTHFTRLNHYLQTAVNPTYQSSIRSHISNFLLLLFFRQHIRCPIYIFNTTHYVSQIFPIPCSLLISQRVREEKRP